MAVPRPNVLVTLSRVLVLTVLATALTFAVTLLVSIISLATISAVRHTTLDMTIAYRVIGVRVVMVVAPIAFIAISAWQGREYVRARSATRPLKFAHKWKVRSGKLKVGSAK
jgi:uncharacterized membrane protein